MPFSELQGSCPLCTDVVTEAQREWSPRQGQAPIPVRASSHRPMRHPGNTGRPFKERKPGLCLEGTGLTLGEDTRLLRGARPRSLGHRGPYFIPPPSSMGPFD